MMTITVTFAAIIIMRSNFITAYVAIAIILVTAIAKEII